MPSLLYNKILPLNCSELLICLMFSSDWNKKLIFLELIHDYLRKKCYICRRKVFMYAAKTRLLNYIFILLIKRLQD